MTLTACGPFAQLGPDKNHVTQAEFDSISTIQGKAMTEQQVINILGEPDSQRSSSERITEPPDMPPTDLVLKQFVYRNDGIGWAEIYFDETGAYKKESYGLK